MWRPSGEEVSEEPGPPGQGETRTAIASRPGIAGVFYLEDP